MANKVKIFSLILIVLSSFVLGTYCISYFNSGKIEETKVFPTMLLLAIGLLSNLEVNKENDARD